MDRWSGFKPIQTQRPEESRLKNALWILVLVVVLVYSFHRAVSGRNDIFVREVVSLSSSGLDLRILRERSGRPWVLTLWAPSCLVCRSFSDELNVVAKDFASEVSFGHVNLEEHPEVGARYNVTAIPTVLFIRNGQVTAQAHAMSRSELAYWIDGRLGGSSR